MLRTLRVFGGRTPPDTKDVIEARTAERQLRCRLGYQSLPKSHIHGPRRNKRHCILPSTLAAHPTWFVMRGQQRSLCPECFPAPVANSLFVALGAKSQIAQQREPMRWRQKQSYACLYSTYRDRSWLCWLEETALFRATSKDCMKPIANSTSSSFSPCVATNAELRQAQVRKVPLGTPASRAR
jgi:hypothetical protein